MSEATPETSSVLAFVEYLVDDDRTSFTATGLGDLAYSLKRSRHGLRLELETWGLSLETKPMKPEPRGFQAWDHNRYEGNPMGGGSGWEQIAGFAGQKG